MRLIEHDARRWIADLGIQVPEGIFLPFHGEVHLLERMSDKPVYIKAQVVQGQRAQRGLVRKCETLEECDAALRQMRHVLHEDACAGFLCVPEVPHGAEWFVSASLQNGTGDFQFSVAEQGGSHVAHVNVYSESLENLPEMLVPIARACFQAMQASDALLIEMNPLVKSSDGTWVALDAKVELDDLAAFRHPEWSLLHPLSRWGEQYTVRESAWTRLAQDFSESRATLSRYVELDGDIATIFFGGGASLLAMDALSRLGGRAANYLEMSGNPDPTFIEAAARIVCSKPGLRALWIAGSWANFTDLSMTLPPILRAISACGLSIPIVIRRDGPGKKEVWRDIRMWANAYSAPIHFAGAEETFEASATQVLHLLAS